MIIEISLLERQSWQFLIRLPRTTAYQRAASSAAFAEAQSQAKRFESEAYEQATSKVGSRPLSSTRVLMKDLAGRI
jgi:hypothetical protein